MLLALPMQNHTSLEDVRTELRSYQTQFEHLLLEWMTCRSEALAGGAKALTVCRNVFNKTTELQLQFITTCQAPAAERREASGNVAKAASLFQRLVDEVKPTLAELDTEDSLNTFTWVASRLDDMKELSVAMVEHFRNSSDQLYKGVFLDFISKLAFQKIDPNHLADSAVQALV